MKCFWVRLFCSIYDIGEWYFYRFCSISGSGVCVMCIKNVCVYVSVCYYFFDLVSYCLISYSIMWFFNY